MGLMDKMKGLVKGREKQIKGGIDTVSNQVEKRVGTKHAGKVDDVSDKAKDGRRQAGRHDDAPAAPATAAATPPVATAADAAGSAHRRPRLSDRGRR